MNTQEMIQNIIDLALSEDGQDITSCALFSPGDMVSAVIMAKDKGVIAGIDIARLIFNRVNPAITCDFVLADGVRVEPGVIVGTVRGPARDILKAERVVLNFMQRMSGIATITAEYVKCLAGTKACILDTRKTSPGNRVLDKLAVKTGGGKNHRMGLWDMALIKDNHIDHVGSITEAVKKVRDTYPEIQIIVEARTLEDVKELMALPVDRIMLDNFSLEDMRKAVMLVQSRIPIEASGGITLQTVRKVAETGVDFISAGDITHSVKALDISMKVRESS